MKQLLTFITAVLVVSFITSGFKRELPVPLATSNPSDFQKQLNKKVFAQRFYWNFIGTNLLQEGNPYYYERDADGYPDCPISGIKLCSIRAYMDAWEEIPDLQTAVDRRYRY